MATIDDAFRYVQRRLYAFNSHNNFEYNGHVGVTERKFKLPAGTLEDMFEEHCTIPLQKYAERCSTAYNNRKKLEGKVPDIPYKSDKPKIKEEPKSEAKPVVKKKQHLSPTKPIKLTPKKKNQGIYVDVSDSNKLLRSYGISNNALKQYGLEYDIHDVSKDKDSIDDIKSGLEEAVKRHGSHMSNGEIVGAATRFRIKDGIVDGLEFID